jgi:rhamnosyl/mannosyltransferase
MKASQTAIGLKVRVGNMKILHVFKTYYPQSFGGVEQVIATLANGLVSSGIQSEVFSLSRKERVVSEPFQDHFRSAARTDFEVLSSPFSLTSIPLFRDLVSRHDIIHYHFPFPFGDVLGLLLARKKPSIVTYHADIVVDKGLLAIYRPVELAFLSSVDRIVATSPAYAKSSPNLRKFQHKVRVADLGLDEELYKECFCEVNLREWQSRLPADFMLFMGVLRHYKGLETLVEAARGFDGYLVIAGDGPYRSKVEKLISRYNLENVILIGEFSDIDKVSLVRLARAVVLPSTLRSEAFGLTLLEASMMGKPMISTELGTGTTHVNIHMETGIVVEPDHADMLHDAMSRLMNDEELAKRFGNAARDRYKNLFQADRMRERYLGLYQELV